MVLPSPGVNAGKGRIVLCSHGSNTVFSELTATYPLKLLSPNISKRCVAIAYVLSYGGGLVGGDSINLTVDIGPRSVLLLLTQVFKTRAGNRAAVQQLPVSPGNLNTLTLSVMDVTISATGALFLLPDPVTCFRAAGYHQKQTFRLSGDASAALLDWITCGRKSLGEEWAFKKYHSVNEVWVDGKRVARDVLLLEDEQRRSDGSRADMPALSARLAPYACYATLILVGPMLRGIILALTERYDAIAVHKGRAPCDLIWSLSMIMDNGGGCIVRVGGKESESVKRWLREALSGLEEVVGLDVYRRAFV